MNILNLYAGLGGNRKLWTGARVTAVESHPEIAAQYQRSFPQDTVIIGDAIGYLENNFAGYDFIWSSPPCQSHSFMRRHNPAAKAIMPDMRLYSQIIFLDSWFKGKYVVENVRPYYRPLLTPQIIDRHLFWSNFVISPITIKKPANLIEDACTSDGRQRLIDHLGIGYEFPIDLSGNGHTEQALKNCVHPSIGLHILKCAMAGQGVLF